MNKRGFFESKIVTGDYVLGGATQLTGEILVPTGDWTEWLPTAEDQSKEGFESYACVSFAVLNAVEILMRQEFGEIQNLSDRWLAWATGTQAKQGNDPTTVCKFLGKKGDVPETDWPYDSTNFYATPPQNLYTLALEFPAEFEYDNQWVPATPEAMKDALTRSPLTVAGYAWAQRNGMYYWPDGALADHYFLVYGYVDGQYWKVFDTYENNLKQVEWNYPFIQVKEHTLHKNVVKPSAFALFVQWLRQALGLEGMSFGAARSPQWEALSRAYRKEQPLCEFGMHKPTKLNPLNTHHVVPFHLDISKELLKSNWINLCRFHHLWNGHLGAWASSNSSVREDAISFTEKVKNRP